MTTVAEQAHRKASTTILDWMQDECPLELVSKILAFSGPQIVMALSKTNRHWHHVMEQEAVWKSLCEDLYKVCYCFLLIGRPVVVYECSIGTAFFADTMLLRSYFSSI
jgi:hypothetical protein